MLLVLKMNMLDTEKVINKVSIQKDHFLMLTRKRKARKGKKIVKDDSETFLKGMMEIMKNFTESQDKRIGSLI